MEIKHFSKGDTVYVLNGNEISEMKVVSVGNKCVNVGSCENTPECGWTAFKQTDHNCSAENSLPYLEEDKDWGERKLLFRDKTGIEQYTERRELEKWFAEEICGHEDNIRNYSLQQLRAVRDILTEIKYA